MTTIPSPPDRTDVLIVGAGPAGLALAAALARNAVDHVLIDREPLAHHTSRAAVVHAGTLEALEAVGATEALLRRGLRVPRFTVRARGRTLTSLDFSTLATRYPFTLMVPQDVTEAVLAERLTAHGGALFDGWQLQHLELAGTGEPAVAHVSGLDGATTDVTARFVVGADGLRSTVRETMDLPFRGDTYPQRFALADVELEWPLPTDEVQLFLAREGLVVVAPLPSGHHRVVASTDDSHPDLTPDGVQRLLTARDVRRANVLGVEWSSAFSVQHRLTDRFRAGNAFLVGDAAHVHSPAGGQGMNLGLHDAIALAALLTDVLDGSAPEAHLDQYDAVRRPAARAVVAMTDRMTRAATLSGPRAQLRDAALIAMGHLPPARKALAARLAQLDDNARRS